MFKKILYPTDLSDVAAKALAFIEQLKASGEEEVIILYVMEDKYFYLLDEYSAIDIVKFENDVKDDIMKGLNTVANVLRDKGFKINVKIIKGAPVTEILRIEQEEQSLSLYSDRMERATSERCYWDRFRKQS